MTNALVLLADAELALLPAWSAERFMNPAPGTALPTGCFVIHSWDAAEAEFVRDPEPFYWLLEERVGQLRRALRDQCSQEERSAIDRALDAWPDPFVDRQDDLGELPIENLDLVRRLILLAAVTGQQREFAHRLSHLLLAGLFPCGHRPNGSSIDLVVYDAKGSVTGRAPPRRRARRLAVRPPPREATACGAMVALPDRDALDSSWRLAVGTVGLRWADIGVTVGYLQRHVHRQWAMGNAFVLGEEPGPVFSIVRQFALSHDPQPLYVSLKLDDAWCLWGEGHRPRFTPDPADRHVDAAAMLQFLTRRFGVDPSAVDRYLVPWGVDESDIDPRWEARRAYPDDRYPTGDGRQLYDLLGRLGVAVDRLPYVDDATSGWLDQVAKNL